MVTVNNFTLSLDDIKNRSLDETIELYRQGYRLEANDDTYRYLDNSSINNNKIENLADFGGISVSTGTLIVIGVGILAYIYLKNRI